MRHFKAAFLAICVLFLFVSSVLAYNGGTGEPNNPYQIADANNWQQLMNTSDHWDKHFVLTADVNLEGVTVIPVGNFTGVFDGNSHVISNIVINLPANYYVGLFGTVGSSGHIKNLGVEDANIAGAAAVACLVGANEGSLTFCHATGTVIGESLVGGLTGNNSGFVTSCYAACDVIGNEDYIGGLVGMNNAGNITSCHSAGDVNGYIRVGGLVGKNNIDGNITESYATGTVSGGRNVGGLVGENDNGTLASCFAASSVSGTEYCIGGLVGVNEGNVTTSFSAGTVMGQSDVGGFIGNNSHGPVSDSYSLAQVTGDMYVGGLLGRNNDGLAARCYAAGVVDGNDPVGALVGINRTGSGLYEKCFWDTSINPDVNAIGSQTSGGTTDPNVIGKTTTDMKKLSTFTSAGWDFVETWGIGENQTYPYLRTEPAGDLNHDAKVDFSDFAILASHWLEGF